MRPLSKAGPALLLALAAGAFASLPSQSGYLRTPPRAGAPDDSLPAIPPGAPAPRSGDAPAAPGHEAIRALARRGLLDSALALCRLALQADSNDAFAAFMAAKLVPEGRISAEYFRKVQGGALPGAATPLRGEAGPEIEESYFRLGQFHYAAGKYYLAIPYFRDYLRLFPSGEWKEPAHYWMANACLAFAQARPEKAAYLDTASAYLERLLAASGPEDYYHALGWEAMAKIKASRGDGRGAWEAIAKALEKAPEDEKASITLLAAQLRKGASRQEEKAFLENLVARYPQSPEVRYLRRINKETDPAKWRSGTGPARLTTAPAAPAEPPAVAGQAIPAPGGPETPQGREAPAPQAVPSTPFSEAPSGGFTLQLGAFAQEGNAQSLAGGIRKLGHAAEIVESERNGKRIYQVRLGRFATAEAAQAFAQRHLKPNKVLSQAIPVP